MHSDARSFRSICSLGLLALVALAGSARAQAPAAPAPRAQSIQQDPYAFFDELIEVRHLIATRYVDKVDDDLLRRGAIRGMVEALDDQYTVYVPAEGQRRFNQGLTGQYVGIGAQITLQTGVPTIVTPLDDSPALKAGLQPDDRIVAIDATPTLNIGMERASRLLQGQPGTKVILTIERGEERFDVTIERQQIRTRNVRGVQREAGEAPRWQYFIDPARRIAYIRLTQFTPGVADDLARVLSELGAGEGTLGGLILDVRFNPGGLLDEATQIADMFLREGTIVSTRGRVVGERTTTARAEGTLPDFPLVVLVNAESASASEVLAGALLENQGRAVVVGARSFGKGSVQSVITLAEGGGSELKLTEQGYFLPSGRSISRRDNSTTWGVDPSPGFYVPMGEQQVADMLEVRRQLEIIDVAGTRRGESTSADPSDDQPPLDAALAQRLSSPAWNDPSWIEQTIKDPQLAAALRAMQLRLDGGAWSPTGQSVAIDQAVAVSEVLRLRQYRDRLERELERTDRQIELLMFNVGDQSIQNPKDLWPNNRSAAGGTVEVRDRDGNLIARLRVNGNSLERWLMDADVTPLPADAQPAAPRP